MIAGCEGTDWIGGRSNMRMHTCDSWIRRRPKKQIMIPAQTASAVRKPLRS
jgi:hypothetical protein